MTVQDIDVRMIKRAARGDSEAFARLFDSEYQHVFRYAMWMCGDPDTAEDITQETFIRAHKGLDRLGPPYNIRAWLFRLAHNYHIDLTRRRDPAVRLDPDAPIAAQTPNPEWQVAFGEMSTGVTFALGRVPTNQREVLVLREIEGMQYQDIAEVLGLSLDNVRVMLHRARNTFKDHYATRLLAEDPRTRCEVLGDLLDSFVDGEMLPAEQDRLVRQHIKQCDSCQQRKREIAAIAVLLRGLQDRLMPRRIRDRVMQRVKGKWRLARVLALGAVTLLAAVLGAGVVAAGDLPDLAAVLEALDSAGVEEFAPEATATQIDTPTPTDAPVVAPPLPPSGDDTLIVAVWACEHLGSNVFQWVEARVTYEDGVPVEAETLSGPYQGGWQPNCPLGEPPSGDGGSSDSGGGTTSGGSTTGGSSTTSGSTGSTGGQCSATCGDQFCDMACGEDKQTCAVDCQQCSIIYCGDQTCQTWCGEDKTTCTIDCP